MGGGVGPIPIGGIGPGTLVVFPGETITVDMWQDGDVISFEARVKERGVTVIRNGKCVLG